MKSAEVSGISQAAQVGVMGPKGWILGWEM